MKFKKTLLAFCLIMCILFCISSVAAGDVNETTITSDYTITNEETLTTEEISDDKTAIDENDIITKANEDENDADSVLTVKNDETPSSVVEGENIKITVYKQTGNYASDKKLYFRVTDSSDNPVYVFDNSMEINYIVNGQDYTVFTSTNSNGEGSINWPIPEMTAGGTFTTMLTVSSVSGIDVFSTIYIFAVQISPKTTEQTVATQPAKQALTIKPTKLSTAYKSGKKFQAKVIDSKTKKAVKGVEITMKVFTGKNAKTVNLKSNAKGIIIYSSSNLGVGTHKVVLKVKKSNTYTGKSKASSIKISKATLKISAPKVTKYYKKAGKFKVTVKSKANGKAVKGVPVNAIVYTGSSHKTIALKSNAKGNVAFSTAKLSVGTHKVVLKIKNNKKYAGKAKITSI